MVDRLGSLTRAIATLRKSLDASGAAALKRPAGSPVQARRHPDEGVRAAQSHVGTLASRLAVLRRDDPQRTRKALRLFIEAVLLDELGGQLILSAEFERLVERSVAAIEKDESLRETLLQATQDLFPKS
jgi:hypothetical protein